MSCLSTGASEGLIGEGWPRRWTQDFKPAEEKSLGDCATQRLRQLVNSGEVTTAPVDRDEDSYGRKLRIVKVDGESVGETLVDDGLARWYRRRAAAMVLMRSWIGFRNNLPIKCVGLILVVMSDDPIKNALATVPRIATEDVVPVGLLPTGFDSKYEIKSFRNAANLLTSAHPSGFQQLLGVLDSFEILMEDILKKGGNKSQVAKKLEAALHPLGWNETRISGDLLVRKRAKALNTKTKSPKFIRVEDASVLENFLDGHQIDFVKDRVAFDLEWNSKDQTFDRDLYAMRAFYECGIIDVGIILTRSTNLSKMFADIASRADSTKSFKDKYGASTTWMGKLDYRVNAGRAGGCPILALGFQEAVFTDLGSWRQTHPILDASVTAESMLVEDEDDD